MSRRLIIHADDFGANDTVNRGIVRAHREGMVTATSIMVGGAAWQAACALARDNPTLDVGIHLVLTDAAPVAPRDEIPALLDASGCFLPDSSTFLRRWLTGAIPCAQVATALEAQIARLRDCGIRPSHIDSHQHLHMLPGIYLLVRELARRHAIPFVRACAERQWRLLWRGSRRGQTGRLLQQLGLRTLAQLQFAQRHAGCDRFYGFYCGGAMQPRDLKEIVTMIPNHATAELMCHPGEAATHEYNGGTYRRDEELALLTDPELRRWVETRVRLTNFRELAHDP